MRGLALLAVLFLLLAQTNLAREKKPQYAHDARAVLSFLEREFWDPKEGGFFSNPYGSPVKLSYEQALVAFAEYTLYNATGDRKYLDRAEAVMSRLSSYDSPTGGCLRIAKEQGPFHAREQSVIMTAYLEAYRNTGKEEYRSRYRTLAAFILSKLRDPDRPGAIRAWWDADTGNWSQGSQCADFFEPAASFFQAYAIDGNQTYLDAAKEILAGSEILWDDDNYGYSHAIDDDTRRTRDHALGALAYLSAYDQTNRKDYLQRAIEILFYSVSRLGDQVSRTFCEAVSRDGEVTDARRRTVDHLLMARVYMYAYEVTLEDKYLNQGRSLLDSVLSKAYDASVGSFTDQIGGGVMGDLQVQAHGAITLIQGYRILTVGPSPLISIVVMAAMVGLVVFVVYLFRKSWPY